MASGPVKSIPWDLVVKEGLRLVDSARRARTERSEETARSTSAENRSSIDELRQRLDDAEEQNRRDAELAEQLATQVRLLTAAADQLRGRTRVALWLAGAALVLAVGLLVAFAFAF